MTTDANVLVDNSTGAIVRLAGIHAAALLVPALVIGVLVVPVIAAVLLAAVVAGAVTAVRLRGMDARVASRLQARPVQDGEHARLVNLVEHLTMAAGVSPPRIHAIDSTASNAVVWGTGNGPASIAATTGLLDAAERVELEAVVAHLLTCIRDHLIEGPTVATALFGDLLVGPVRSIALGPLDLERVVATDLEAARITRYPPGSAAALERIQSAAAVTVETPRALRPLWIVDPVDGSETDPFALHPPLGDRIDLIREM